MDVVTLLTIAGTVVATAGVVYLIFASGVRSKSYEEALADQRRAQVEVKEKSVVAKKVWRVKKHRHERKKKEKQAAGGDAADVIADVIGDVISDTAVHGEGAGDACSQQTSCSQSTDDTTTTAAVLSAEQARHMDVDAESVDDDVVGTVSSSSPSVTPDPPVVNGRTEAITNGDCVDAPSLPSTTATTSTTATASTTATTSTTATATTLPVNGTCHRLEVENGEGAVATAGAAPYAAVGGGSVRKRRTGDKRRNNAGSSDAMSMQRMGALLDAMPLTSSEIQTLIDQLLNKQSSCEWVSTASHRPDPLTLLKKQLADLQQRLANEQKTCSSAEDRLQLLRQQLNQERARGQQLQRDLEQLTARDQAELSRQLQQLGTRHAAELAAVQQQLATARQSCASDLRHKQELARVTGELELAQTRVSTVCSELDTARSQATTELEQLRRQLTAADGARQLVAGELQQLQALHGGVERENNALKQQLAECEGRLAEERAAAERRLAEDTAKLLNELQETRVELEHAREDAGSSLTKQQAELVEQQQRLRTQLSQQQAAAVSAERRRLLQLLAAALPSSTPAAAGLAQLDPDVSQFDAQLKSSIVSVVNEAVTAATTDSNATAADVSSTQDQLQRDNETLQQRVQHYQVVLADTESILTRLQQSVEEEERSWQLQLAEKQLQIEQLQQMTGAETSIAAAEYA